MYYVSHLLFIPQGDTTHLIYSYHAEDPLNNEQLSQHQFQGSFTINLFGQPESVSALPDDVQSFKIANSNVSYINCTHPAALSLTYCCMYILGINTNKGNNLFMHFNGSAKSLSKQNILHTKSM